MRLFQHGFNSRPPFFASMLLAFALVLSGCAGSRSSNVAYDPTNFDAPDVATLVATPGDARIAPLDKLDIRVFQVADLSGEYQVDSSGKISFPLIGPVTAAGKTAADLSQLLASRLGAKYLQSPKVQVNITEASPQTVTVDGSVRQPGVFPIKGATTLMRAVALARGAADDANPRSVIVFRTINGERVAGAFDLTAIRRAEAQDPAIYGNDIIIVDGSRARSVFRDLLSSLPLLGILRPF